MWFIVGSKGTEKSGRHSWYQSWLVHLLFVRVIGRSRSAFEWRGINSYSYISTVIVVGYVERRAVKSALR